MEKANLSGWPLRVLWRRGGGRLLQAPAVSPSAFAARHELSDPIGYRVA